MADSTISALLEVPLSSVALTDFLPIVNSGTTQKITLSTLFSASSAAFVPYINANIDPTILLTQTNYPFWNLAYTTVTSASSDWIAHLKNTNNIFVGPSPFFTFLTTGYKNIAIGIDALSATTTGSGNVSIGYQSLATNNTGSGNTAVGYNAGYFNLSGINNTYIGNQCSGNTPCESNTVNLGNGAIKTLRCQAQTITSLSDKRDKKEIVSFETGLKLINELNPVSFVWNSRDGSKQDTKDTGFIAQELLEAQMNANVSIPGLVDYSNSDKLEASYAKLIPVLVKAIQELSKEIEKLKK